MPPGEFDPKRVQAQLPPLIKGYLRLGGFVGDGAVIDSQFNTTDVAVVVKTDLVTDKYYRHYERQLARRARLSARASCMRRQDLTRGIIHADVRNRVKKVRLVFDVIAAFPSEGLRRDAVLRIAWDGRREREPGGNRPAFHGSEDGVHRSRATLQVSPLRALLGWVCGRLDGRRSASAGESGAAGIADSARAAARTALRCARNGHPTAGGARRGSAEPSGARQQRRGRGRHRLSAAGDRPACRWPGRTGGAAAADRCGATGDPAALPRPTATCSPPSRPTSTPTAGCASWSPRAASPASSWTATSARPARRCLRFLNRLTEKQPIDSVTLERYLLLAQDVPGVTPARGAGTFGRSRPAR